MWTSEDEVVDPLEVERDDLLDRATEGDAARVVGLTNLYTEYIGTIEEVEEHPDHVEVWVGVSSSQSWEPDEPRSTATLSAGHSKTISVSSGNVSKWAVTLRDHDRTFSMDMPGGCLVELEVGWVVSHTVGRISSLDTE